MCATAAGLPDQCERHDHLSGVHGWSPACGRSVGCVSQEVGCCEGDACGGGVLLVDSDGVCKLTDEQ